MFPEPDPPAECLGLAYDRGDALPREEQAYLLYEFEGDTRGAPLSVPLDDVLPNYNEPALGAGDAEEDAPVLAPRLRVAGVLLECGFCVACIYFKQISTRSN